MPISNEHERAKVRLTADQTPKIKKLAQHNCRSITNEVTIAIESHIAANRRHLNSGLKMPKGARK